MPDFDTSRFPDADKIIEVVAMKEFMFSTEQLRDCHQRFWHNYPEEQFFRFMQWRTQVEELWDDVGFSGKTTSLQMHHMTTGHREIYTMIAVNEVYLIAMLQDNFSMVVRTSDTAMKKFTDDIDRVGHLMHWYRRRAQQQGAIKVDRVLRGVMKLIMNLPDSPSVWLVPDSENKLLAIQIIWKNRPDCEALTFTVTAPKQHIF